MKLKQLAVALLCGTMIVSPALAQSTTAPAGLGTSPNGLTTTTVNPGGGMSSTSSVPASRGAVPTGGSAATTITSGGNTRPAGQAPAGLGTSPNGLVSTSRPMPATGAMAMPAGTAMPAMSMTNINTASAVDLDKLPQIGKARAAKIIKMRPYASTDELVSKKVLPMSVYNKIKTQITAS